VGQTEQEVREWFEEAWEEAAALPALEGFGIECHVEYPPQLTDAELAALRREAEGKPDHPNWREIEAEERRRRQPLGSSRVMIWNDQKGRWRYNQSYLISTTDEPSYVDAVVAGSVMWQLTPEALHIAPTDKGTATGTHGDPRSREGSMRVLLSELLYGRLGVGADAGNAPDGRVELLPGHRWAAYVSRGEDFELRYEGTWDIPAARGTVETVVVTRTSERGVALRGTRYAFEGWRLDPVSQRWLAQAASETSAGGVVMQRTVLDAVTKVTPAEFDALFEVPPIDGEDPVRGRMTYHSLYDHRPSALVRQDFGPDREVVSVADLPGAKSWRRWRVAGWVVAGVLSSVFIGLRVRSSRTGTDG
jgi:hypothetical protein